VPRREHRCEPEHHHDRDIHQEQQRKSAERGFHLWRFRGGDLAKEHARGGVDRADTGAIHEAKDELLAQAAAKAFGE
jgi:hypothetical protein